jgi:4-hydroxy-tetrahydrodipicolinate reductase
MRGRRAGKDTNVNEDGRTKVAVAGVAGRMGKAIVRCARGRSNVQLVGAVESAGHPDLGRDAGEVAECGKIGLTVTADLPTVANLADVVVDFTFHTAVPGNAKIAQDLRRALVVGTTGLDAGERDALRRASAWVPVVWAPNMSLGVNLLFSVVKQAAAALGEGYRVEIDETHHIHKKDAPSGTALRLGEKVAEGLKRDFQSFVFHDPEGRTGHHPEGRLLIRSHRQGEVVGDHTVAFENAAERIEFSHRARSRDAFAMGALAAAVWVVSRRPGLYDMQNVMGL